MDKRRLNWVAWGFVGVTALVLVLMLANTLHRPEEIVLPSTDAAQDPTGGDPNADSALQEVKVTPATVQAAVATLERPESYRRTVTIEQMWTGGSGSYEITMAVSGSWTRTDRTMPDGRVRHTITGPDTVYIWYNSEGDVYSAPVGEITADDELSIPTYEELLTLEPDQITAADYRALSGVNCIYAEALEGSYTLRYWVSVDSGLLVSAEKLAGEETVYRMSSLTLDQTEPTAADFTLPDGTVLA